MNFQTTNVSSGITLKRYCREMTADRPSEDSACQHLIGDMPQMKTVLGKTTG